MGRYSPEATENKRRANWERWVAKAVEIHGSQYDYTLSETTFVRQKASLLIHCNRHNLDFEVTAFDHLRYNGGGCPSCEFEYRSVAQKAKGYDTFTAQFQSMYADRLELLSEYTGMKQPVKVRCKKHLVETEVVSGALIHSSAWGCPICAKESVASKSRLTFDAVREMYGKSLPPHVEILSIEHTPNKPAVITVGCDIHGESKVLVGYLRRSANQRGHFCPRCGDEAIGYAGYRLRRLLEKGQVGRPTWLGVMEVEVFGISSLKVGISTRPLTERYGSDLKAIYFSALLPERDALLIENEIHRSFKEFSDKRILNAGMRNGKRWSGDTECYFFKAQSGILDTVNKRLNEVERNTFDYISSLKEFAEPDFTERNVSRPKGVRNMPKPVVCLDTEDWFPSATDAALWAGCSQGNLSAVLAGKRRIAGGYRWMWADEFVNLVELPALPEKKLKRRMVLRVEDGQVFSSVSDAARSSETTSGHITSVCRGQRKTAGGYSWKYMDE